MVRLSRQRGLCFVVTAVFGLALLGAAHHRATAQHGYCSDHGELVHLDEHHGHHLHRASRPATTGSRIMAASAEVHGAHNCLFLAFLAQPVRSGARAAALADANDHLGLTAAGPEAAHRDIGLLHLAPKSSPPA